MSRWRRWTPWIVLELGLWLATGIYVIDLDQIGLVRRFGRLDPEPRRPGLHYDWPWPCSQVDRLRTDETRQVTLGFAPVSEKLLPFTTEERLSEFLTGDQNLIHVQAAAQYRLANPEKFLLRQAAAEGLLTSALEAALVEELAIRGVDDILTGARAELQSRMLLRAQALADDYDLGITLSSVSLSSVRPPTEVAQAFLDVVKSRSERERLLHEAQGEQLRFLALAEGERRQQLNAAEATRETLIAKAEGDAAYFASILKPLDVMPETQRSQARTMTMDRLWTESLSRIFPRLRSKLYLAPGEPADVSIWLNEEK